MIERDGWYWVTYDVTQKGFTMPVTVGVDVRGGRVAETAPFARWTLGRRWARVSRHYRRKGAQIVKLRPEDIPF